MTPYVQDPDFTLWNGDVRDVLRELPAESVDCALTSPPFFGLRDYGTGQWEGGDPGCDHKPPEKPGRLMDNGQGAAYASNNQNWQERGRGFAGSECGKCGARRVDRQIGLEATPDEWVTELVGVFREVRRVLRPAGTLWVECGDSYAASMTSDRRMFQPTGPHGTPATGRESVATGQRTAVGGLKPKDLLGQPWLLAQALRDPYYTGDIASERDRVWLAATVDAEGCIAGNRHVRKDEGRVRTAVHLSITNTSKAMLDEAERIWPASRQQHDSREGSIGSRECWRWVATNVDRCSLLMRELYPHLIVKRKQAMLAFNFYEMSRESKRFGKTRVGEEMRGRRDWIVGALSDLNHGRPVDMPSWIHEPPSVFEPGWYLRQIIIWRKPNSMPESVRDRCTTAHSYLMLFAKNPRYWFDADAIAEPVLSEASIARNGSTPRSFGSARAVAGGTMRKDADRRLVVDESAGRNARSVWTIPTQGYAEAHFATWPEALVERILKAGCPEWVCGTCGKARERLTEVSYGKSPAHGAGSIQGSRGITATDTHMDGGRSNKEGVQGQPRVAKISETVGWSDCGHGNYRPGVALDPFMGSGTTALVARRLGRASVGVELSSEYCAMAAKRLSQLSLLAEGAA